MMAKNIPDIVGNRYGRWTVIGNADKCQSGEKKILCRCDCGTEKVLRRSSVTSGNSKSCGCYASEEKIKNATSHGCSRTRLYRIWAASYKDVTTTLRIMNGKNTEGAELGHATIGATSVNSKSGPCQTGTMTS